MPAPSSVVVYWMFRSVKLCLANSPQTAASLIRTRALLGVQRGQQSPCVARTNAISERLQEGDRKRERAVILHRKHTVTSSVLLLSQPMRGSYRRSISWMETPWVYSWLMRARRALGQMLASGSETFTFLSRRKATA